MVSVKWCLDQKNGLELTEPNPVLADSYIRMAEESLGVLGAVKASRIWTATTTYYVFYYSLYALMRRIGVKCEIHACSLAFMKQFLGDFYSATDMKMTHQAFTARIDLQYYTDRPVDEKAIEGAKRHCRNFFIKTKDALARITEDQITIIRKALVAQNSQGQGSMGLRSIHFPPRSPD